LRIREYKSSKRTLNWVQGVIETYQIKGEKGGLETGLKLCVILPNVTKRLWLNKKKGEKPVQTWRLGGKLRSGKIGRNLR